MKFGGIEPSRLEEQLAEVVDREGGGPAGWTDGLSRYLELLITANQRVNLVSRRTSDRVVELQVLPSLAALLVVRQGSRERVVDVGTGGGFPGIPLKILRPEIRLDLVEARRKKCEFLEACVEELALGEVRVHWCRVEEPSEALLERAPFDLGLTRAAGGGRPFGEAVSRLIRPEGSLWVYDRPEVSGLTWRDRDGKALTTLVRFPESASAGRGQGAL